jgi:AbrB family looped-hinge helix DNA binding protein
MKVTIKGQVTIPARIREYLGIQPHSEVDFRITDGNVVLVKSEGENAAKNKFSAMRGILKGTRTTSQWMRETRGA